MAVSLLLTCSRNQTIIDEPFPEECADASEEDLVVNCDESNPPTFSWNALCEVESYRLVVKFNYAAGVARVRFAGTHEEYDRIDVTEV